jgi:hypothetical protein
MASIDFSGSLHDPIIIVKGLKLPKSSENEAVHIEMLRRGYIVRSTLRIDDTVNLAVTLTPLLMSKLAFKHGIQVRHAKRYKAREKWALAGAAVEELIGSTLGMQSAWVAHDYRFLAKIRGATSVDERLELINEYYGSKMAYYFGWLSFYSRSLSIIAIPGALLFMQSFFIDSTDSPLIPAYAVLIVIWSTYFLASWSRRSNELKFRWNEERSVFGVESGSTSRLSSENTSRAAFKGEVS